MITQDILKKMRYRDFCSVSMCKTTSQNFDPLNSVLNPIPNLGLLNSATDPALASALRSVFNSASNNPTDIPPNPIRMGVNIGIETGSNIRVKQLSDDNLEQPASQHKKRSI